MGIQTRTVTKALKAKGYDAELIYGKDYFYFVGPRTEKWKTTSIMTPRINDYDLGGWVKNFEDLIEENEGAAVALVEAPAVSKVKKVEEKPTKTLPEKLGKGEFTLKQMFDAGLPPAWRQILMDGEADKKVTGLKFEVRGRVKRKVIVGFVDGELTTFEPTAMCAEGDDPFWQEAKIKKVYEERQTVALEKLGVI